MMRELDDWPSADVLQLRATMRLSQSEFAAALRRLGKTMEGSEPVTDRGTISRWERGAERPSLYYRRLLTELDRRLGAQSVKELRRRELLRLGGAMTGMATLWPSLESWDRLLLALRGAVPVDDRTVSDVESETSGFHELERQVPGRQLLPRLDAHIDRLADLLRGQLSPALRRRLVVTAGDAAALAGWIAWDVHDRVASMRLYQTAAAASREATDPALLACILAYRSFPIGVHGDRHHRAAVDLLSEAVRQADKAGDPMVMAWVRARHAEELAGLGASSAIDVIERAQALFDAGHGDHVRPWTRFVDRARMAGFTTSVYLRLGQTQLAEDSIEMTLNALGTAGSLSKRRALILADIAGLQLQQGAVEPGVEFANEALDLAIQSESSPALGRLGNLLPQLRHWVHEPAARSLDERLRAVCARA